MSFFDSISSGAQIALPVVGGAIGAYFGGPMGGMAGATAGSAAAQFWANQENYEQQKKQYSYQKQLQKDIFAREDNAIFRRTQDLIRSGLSPVLGAGSGAGAGSPIPVKAPQREFNPDVAMAVMNMIKMKEDITNTVEQRKLIQAQSSLANVGASTKAWDLEKFKEWNLPSNASGLAKTIRDLGSLAGGLLPQIKSPIDDIKSKLELDEQIRRYKKAYEENQRLKDVQKGYWWKKTNKEMFPFIFKK